MKSEAISHRTVYMILSIMAVSILYGQRQGQAGSNEKDGLTPTRTYLWHQATAAATWPGRSSHTVVAFQDKLWLFEGVSNDEGGRHTDIWSSIDGVNWSQVTAIVPWSPRACRIVIFQDMMWLLGGGTTVTDANDVWNSVDGIQWMNVTGIAKWTPRQYFTAAALADRMLVIGGNVNDVWFSTEGNTWVQAAASVPWVDRMGPHSITFSDRVWIFGGAHYDPVYGTLDLLNDVWSTPDGISWTQAVSHTEWHARGGFGLTVFDNQLWVLGGSYETGSGPGSYIQYLNDVWRSLDGTNWIQAPIADWSHRAGHATVVFHNRLWVFGGWTKVDDQDSFLTNDVWYMEPDPGAMLSGSPLSGAEPLTVQFTDASTATATPISEWHWDFGDGTSSEDQNPSHTYSARGVYTVSLTVTAGSFYNTDTEEAYITVTGEQHPFHTADQNQDNTISLPELLRVIQFYNSDGFHCAPGTEDGYGPGPAPDKGELRFIPALNLSQGTSISDTTKPDLSRRSETKPDCPFHDSDYNPPDWTINMTELLRLVQLFNSGSYHACEGGEDGFCPGP